MHAESGKAERLFRAAVSAFCSLTRPSRREIAQLEDLTLPLFDQVSVDGRRFVAAALSECDYAPAGLVRRLCEEPVDIAAPLLIRSAVVSDIDMIALIGRHGLPHARAIARRKDLNPTIATLIRAIEKPTLVAMPKPAVTAKEVLETIAPAADPTPKTEAPRVPGQAAETVRHRLRSMMLPDQQNEDPGLANPKGSTVYIKLRETALTGNLVFFQTALADALELDFATARDLTATTNYMSMLIALRALDLSEDRAFLIAVAVSPKLFPHPQAIKLFLDRFRTLHREAALEKVRGWKAEAASQGILAKDRSSPNIDRSAPVRPLGQQSVLRVSSR